MGGLKGRKEKGNMMLLYYNLKNKKKELKVSLNYAVDSSSLKATKKIKH